MSEKQENLGQLLKVGTPAILHPEPHHADSVRLRAVIRGWQPGAYIILDIPREEAYTFRVEQRVVLRFVAEGDACGFDCQLLDRGSGPFFSFVRLSWPNEFTSVRIRKHERVEVNVPCVVQTLGGPSFHAEIGDISTGGCRLLSPRALAVGRDVQLSFTLPDGVQVNGLSAIVRTVKPSRSHSVLGCKFVEGQDDIIGQLDLFIAASLESMRGGAGDAVRVVVLENGMTLAGLLRPLFLEAGIEAIAVAQVIDAVSLLRTGRPAALVVSQSQPELDGLTLCRCIRATNRFEEFPLFLCGEKDKDLEKQACALGVTACFAPTEAREMAAAIIACLKEREAETQPAE